VSGMSPLSLAYMIEISFVINLAYHELNTFKLQDRIGRHAKDLSSKFDGMWSDSNETLVAPEWTYLKEFHTGVNRDAWEGKWRCILYREIFKCCVDRFTVRGFMILDVVILVVATVTASTPISLFDDPLTLPEKWWWVGFSLLLITIIVPPLFAISIRLCTRYAFGHMDGDVFDRRDPGGLYAGRVGQLEQAVLVKVKRMTLILSEAQNGSVAT